MLGNSWLSLFKKRLSVSHSSPRSLSVLRNHDSSLPAILKRFLSRAAVTRLRNEAQSRNHNLIAMADPMTNLKDNLHNLPETWRRDLPNAPYDEVVATSAVFYPAVEPQPLLGCENPPAKQYRLLLIQRSADEPLCPNVWELPGGQVELHDRTIQDAVFRKHEEEIGLVGVSMKGALRNAVFEYKNEEEQMSNDEIITRSIQLTYILEVEHNSNQIALNREEHQSRGWFTTKEAATLDITTGTRKIIEDAFLNGPSLL